jgi:hypothetical protein
MTSSVFHKDNPLTISLGEQTVSSVLTSANPGTLLDTSCFIPSDSPTDRVLAKFYSAGLLNADYQLQSEAIQSQLPLLSTKQLLAIDRLLSHNLGFNIPLLNQAGIYSISLSMKEFLRELQEGCREKNIKIENILIIGGAVPWILGSKYCVDLLESIVPGSTASLSDKELMPIDLPPNDVDIRFIISPASKAHIPWLKNRIVAYLTNKLPSYYSQRDREDMITSIGNVFQEFQETILWDQQNRQIDIDYFIFGINDLSQSKYEVSLVSLLRRPFLFSMQNLCLDIQDFLAEETTEVVLRPRSLSQPHDSREAVQAILEKMTRIFHVPCPETVDKKGWVYYCSLLTKLYHCPEKSSLCVIRTTTIEHCVKESKDPSKKCNSPISFLVALLKAAIQKHHDIKPEDAMALAFNICSTAEEACSQSDLSLLWEGLVCSSSKSLLPLHVFSRAMHNPTFTFEVLSAVVELQGFFYLCSPWAVESPEFTVHPIVNNGRQTLQFIDKNKGLILPLDLVKALQLVDKKMTELAGKGEDASLDELECVWKAFSIPTNSNEVVPVVIREADRLQIPYGDLETQALRMMEHETRLGRMMGYQLFLCLQITRPETGRQGILIRHLPAMAAMEGTHGARLRLLRQISKALLATPRTESSMRLQGAFEEILATISQPEVQKEQILIEWSLALARIHAHPFYAEAFFFWKQYQSLIQGKEDQLSERLIREVLPANMSMAAELLLQIPSCSTVKKLPLYFLLFAKRNRHKNDSKILIDLELLLLLTIKLFPDISLEAATDKDQLAKIINELIEEALGQKQFSYARELLSTEEKKKVLSTQEAAKAWAIVCYGVFKDSSGGIAAAFEIYQEAAHLGIWTECKPRKLLLQLIEGLYKQTDPCHWFQADALVEELCNDPATSDVIKKTAVHLLIGKKERVSLKESPVYNKIKTLFHPTERLDVLRQLLQEQIAKAAISESISILKELMEIDPLPEIFIKDLVEVCHLIDRIVRGGSMTDVGSHQAVLKILFHPSILKTFNKTELFPFNFAIYLCHNLHHRGVAALEPVIADLTLLCTKAPKASIVPLHRLHLSELLSKAVCLADRDILIKLATQLEPVLGCLKEGGHFASLCAFILNCKDLQIRLDETSNFYSSLIWALERVLESDSAESTIRMGLHLLKTYASVDRRFMASFDMLKPKMMDALLKKSLFVESSQWVEHLGKEAFLATLSGSIALDWVAKLAAGGQYEAAAKVSTGVYKASNTSTEACACARIWLTLPAEMVRRYPHIAAKYCLQASREMTDELQPLVERICFAFQDSDANTVPIESVVSLLEQYTVPHPRIWQRVFSKVEALAGKESKAKQKLLPLLTKIGEPSNIFQDDPAARSNCWLSALRTFTPSSYEVLGDSWKKILKNGVDFLQIFPAEDPVVVGEAYSRLLDIWLTSLKKPNEADLFTDLLAWFTPLKDRLTHLLKDSRADAYRQKILLQYIQFGSYTISGEVFLRTTQLCDSLLSDIGRVGLRVTAYKDQDVAKVLKKQFSTAQKIGKLTPKEQTSFARPLAQILRKARDFLSEEAFLGILEHVMTLELFTTDETFLLLWQVLKFFVEKFDARERGSHSSKIDKKRDCRLSQLIKILIDKTEPIILFAEKTPPSEFPLDLFFLYTRFCEHPGLLHFTRSAEHDEAFKNILRMIFLLEKPSLSDEDQNRLVDYIMTGFPYHLVDNSYKQVFFCCVSSIFLTLLDLTKDTSKYKERFDRYIEIYIHFSKTNEIKANFDAYYYILKNLLAFPSHLKKLITERNQEGTIDPELDQCYEEIIDYFCNKNLEIFGLFSTLHVPLLKEAMQARRAMMDQIIKDPWFLRDKYQTAYFKDLRKIFNQMVNNGDYYGYYEQNLFNMLLFFYTFSLGVGVILDKPLVISLIDKVVNWASLSQEPLCVYRMLRIIQCNQKVYVDNPKELIYVYQRARCEVIKNPFYKIPPSQQKEGDLGVDLIHNENSPLEVLISKKRPNTNGDVVITSQEHSDCLMKYFETEAMERPGTDHEVFLFETMTQLCLAMSPEQAACDEIRTSLMDMLVEVFFEALHPASIYKEHYPRVLEALYQLIPTLKEKKSEMCELMQQKIMIKIDAMREEHDYNKDDVLDYERIRQEVGQRLQDLA